MVHFPLWEYLFISLDTQLDYKHCSLKAPTTYVLSWNCWKNFYQYFFTRLITLCKDITFPLITKFKTNGFKLSTELKCGLIDYFIDRNIPVLNLYIQFQFFICKLDKSLCTPLIIWIKHILTFNLLKIKMLIIVWS